MSAQRSSSAVKSSILSAGAMGTPSGPGRADHALKLARSSCKGTITPCVPLAAPGSSSRCRQLSATISRRLSTRRIDALLEGCEADAAIGVDQALAVVAPFAVHLDDALDGFRHGALRHRRPDHLTQGGEAVDRAAERDLIPLLAVLLHAQDADVSHMVMTAGIHTAGHLDFDFPQIVEIVEIVKALLDVASDADRARVGKAAEIKAGAGDHVGQHADIGGRESPAAQAGDSGHAPHE